MKARLAPIVLLCAAVGSPAACSQSAVVEPTTAASSAPAGTAEVYRFHIGALPAFALKDGDIQVPNDGKTFGLGQPPQVVADLLAVAGRSTETIEVSIQPLLVQDGARVLLFDTGAGDVSWAKGGRLPASLRAAGFEPAQVTDIFVSHHHPDHVGGLSTPAGALTFPGASIHLSAPEWEAMRADKEQAALVAIIGPKVAAFEPGAALLPSVTAVPVRGHTPGHSAYAIHSGAERLLFIGDSAHHSVVSVERPDWPIEWDAGLAPEVARASRRALLQRAADEHLRLFAGHFPFPGVGQVQPKGEAFVWVPESAAAGAR
jgi:glyoxylase-like metal-dependent hydrolase (beta-lactamase superfamily II)